jgi:hypothetical protein
MTLMLNIAMVMRAKDLDIRKEPINTINALSNERKKDTTLEIKDWQIWSMRTKRPESSPCNLEI